MPAYLISVEVVFACAYIHFTLQKANQQAPKINKQNYTQVNKLIPVQSDISKTVGDLKHVCDETHTRGCND